MNKNMRAPASEQKNIDPLDETQHPVLITPLHVRDRATSKVAGMPLAWRKMHPIEYMYQQERFGALNSNEAKRRCAAGVLYADIWNCSQKAGRDSTASFDVGRSMGSGVPLTERQTAAIQRLVRLEMLMGENDRTICRAVCWWGHTPVEAMRLAKLGTDTRVSARLCEALDVLADVLERTAKSRGRT